MEHLKRPNTQDVRFELSGLATVKNMTKATTSDDIINSVPSQTGRLSVYMSINGVEKKLSGKTRILKELRAYGSKSDVHFVVKTSGEYKKHRFTKCKLKSRLEAISRRLSRTRRVDITSKATAGSTVPLYSMAASVTNSAMKNTHRFSTIGVAEQLNYAERTPRRATIAATTTNTGDIVRSVLKPTKHVVGDSLTTMKLGFKRASTPANTSNDIVVNKPTTRRRTPFDAGLNDYPRHSTPVTAVPIKAKCRVVVQLPSTPTATKLSRNGGKSNLHGGKPVFVDERKAGEVLSSTPIFTSRDIPNSPALSNQREPNSYFCNHNCDNNRDSSIDSSFECSRLNVAFWDPSIQSETTCHSEGGFDYSFDCTFPSMADCYREDVFACGNGGERKEVGSDGGSDTRSGSSTYSLCERL